MLEDFISQRRDAISARSGTKYPDGVKQFLDQLVAKLASQMVDHHLAASATSHARVLASAGLTIAEAVHEFGGICLAIMDEAIESGMMLTNREVRFLNLCLEQAIAECVSEHARMREAALNAENLASLGFLAHELRNHLMTAYLAYEAVRNGNVGVHGSTSTMLATSLHRMKLLVDRSLTEVRVEAGSVHTGPIVLSELLEEIETASTMEAANHDIDLAVDRMDESVTIDGDLHILSSVVSNLVQNACKFTPAKGHVHVSARATDDRVLIDIADQCGGLPDGEAEVLFQPFKQRGGDRTGLGLGLAICLKGVHQLGGEIHVRDVPGTGCVFTVDIPRRASQS